MRKIVVIDEKPYEMGEITAKAVIQTAKDALKGQNAICALEKGSVIQMKKDTFPSGDELKKEVDKYIKAGFKVSYVMGGDLVGK